MNQAGGVTAQTTIRIAHFKHKRDIVPREHDTTWMELGELLTRHAIRPSKDGPLWSPVSYRPDTKRANANVEMVYALVQDFDHGVQPDDVLPGCERFAYIAHSTHSNMPDDPRWRIIFPLVRPIPSVEWLAVWKKLTAHFGGNTADPACKEPARMYYKPSHPRGSPHWALIHEGEAVDPDEWPNVEEPETETAGSRNGKHESAPAGKGDYRTLDVVAMFKSYGHYGRDMGGGKHAVLCPWYLGHSDADKAKADDSDTVVWEASGKVWPQFDCKHAHCVGREINDVITMWDGDSFCEREYVPLAINLDRGEGEPGAELNGKEPGEAIRAHEKLWTDIGNAERLRDDHGRDIRYCGIWKSWLVWDGKRWWKDVTHEIESRAHDTAKRFYTAAREARDDKKTKFALASESNKSIQAMISRARALPPLKARPEQFDAHPWMLNVQNGTVDLETSKLYEHTRADFFTQIAAAPYDADAKAPRYEQFVKEVMGGDEEMVAFLHRAIGYSLTGSVREKVIFIAFDSTPETTGNNGKSTLLDLIRMIMGDYGMKLPKEMLMMHQMRRSGAASPEIADLRGIRFGYHSETRQGDVLDEALVKELTGLEMLRARQLYERLFSFMPEFKIWLATNYKPEVLGTDTALWNRLPMLPFGTRFVDKPKEKLDPNDPLVKPMDKKLRAKLDQELPGILAIYVRGAKEYLDSGLGIPAKVLKATEDFRAESDKIQAFIDQRLMKGDGFDVRFSEVHEAYLAWAKMNKALSMSQRALTPILKSKGLQSGENHAHQQIWLGVKLQDAPVQIVVASENSKRPGTDF